MCLRYIYIYIYIYIYKATGCLMMRTLPGSHIGIRCCGLGHGVYRVQARGSRWLPTFIQNQKALVAEWIHFTLSVLISPTLKLKVCTFGGL